MLGHYFSNVYNLIKNEEIINCCHSYCKIVYDFRDQVRRLLIMGALCRRGHIRPKVGP